jgi:lysophospholipase L1-like esterase
MVLATAFVFVVTWALHSYQWFWLRGSFPVTVPDILFWGVIGLFVILSSLKESKAGRTRTLGAKIWTLPESFGLAVRTTGMFVTICVIWSMWTSGSIANWRALWIFGEPGWTNGWPMVVGFLTGAIVVGTLVRLYVGRVPTLRVAGPTLDFSRSVLVTGGALLLIAGVGSRRVYPHFGREVADVVLSLRTQRLNEGDLALLTRGYYEDLLGLDRVNTELWELYMKEPAGWYGDESIMYRPTGDFLGREHIPLAQSKAKDIPVIFNRWGMRSADCTKEKPPGTLRIALFGASYAVALGIPVDSTWVGLVEARMNREPLSPTYERAEILNFSVGGYRCTQRLYAMEKRAFDFHPDVVFFMAHENDLTSLKDISDAVRLGNPLPYAELAEMATRAGVGPGTPEAVAERRLQRIGADLVGWTYRRAVQSCREHGAVPVWLFVRTTNEGDWRKPHDVLRRLADEAGFVPLDLGDTYGSTPLRSLFLAEWDHHPNVEGHVMIAERLWSEIRAHPEVFAHASDVTGSTPSMATESGAGQAATASSALPQSKESPQ